MKLTEVDREDGKPEEVVDPDLPIVDAHHHLWPPGYFIPYDVTALGADLGRGHNVVATVFVECMTSYRKDGDEALRPVGETEFVVRDCASPSRVAAGIVAWADLTHPEEVARTLEGHLEAGQGRFRGIRFNVVWHERHARHAGREVPRHILLDESYRKGLREVERRGLTYDVWLFHEQLPELADTVDAFPELTFIVDHLGGPVPEEPTDPTPSSVKVSAPVTYQRSASGSPQPAWLASAVNDRISGGGPKRRRPQAASARAAMTMRRRGSSEEGSEGHNHPAPVALPWPTPGRSGAAAHGHRIGQLTEECDTHISAPTSNY